MSIIHEALKKVESQAAQGLKEPSPKRKRPQLKLYALYLTVVVLGFVSANLIFSFFTRSLHKDFVAANKPSVPLPSPAPLPIAQPRQEDHPDKEPPKQLTLNGIFFSGDKGYALINNQIVKEGDKISGATVVRISLEGVDLKYDDSAVNLSRP